MELRYFLSVLSKRKVLLLLVIMAAAVATYYVVQKLPKKYMSSAVLSTGITDFKGVRVDDPNPFVQEFEIENKFGTLIEYMKSRTSINVVTKALMLHDLLADTLSGAFRNVDLNKINITKEQVDTYLAMIDTPDSMAIDPTNIAAARTLEKAYGYDYESLREHIDIKRNAKTDYVSISYTSENPKLTHFVVDNFIKAFLNIHYAKKENNQNKSYAFYNNLTQQKKRTLDSLNNVFAYYSRSNGIVNLEEQGQSVVTQIKDLEMNRDNELKNRAEAQEYLKVVKEKEVHVANLFEKDYDNALKNNKELIYVDNKLKQLKVVYNTKKDEEVKEEIEDLEDRRIQIMQKYAVGNRREDDRVKRNDDEVFKKSIEAQSKAAGSEEALKAIENQLLVLKDKRGALVIDNAQLGRIEQNIRIAEKEYEYAIERLNQADVIKESSVEEKPMRIIEQPLVPTQPMGNKSALLSAFSGASAGTFATVFLFLLTFFDRSLSTPFQFSKQVGLPLASVLNRLNSRKYINFDILFSAPDTDKNAAFFKESLRKIRHEVEVSEAQTFLVTSLKDQEGKSFLTGALAYMLALKNKKVLIIDTNFKNNTLTGVSAQHLENLLITEGDENPITATRLDIDIIMPKVDIIGNKGGKNSPSELLAGIDFNKKMREFARKYDYIFLEASCLNKYSDARELVDFVDKVIPIFDATTAISSKDTEGITYLKSLGNKVLGSVLNKVELKNLN
jgi:polysaccharide biosynthesis transport protein